MLWGAGENAQSEMSLKKIVGQQVAEGEERERGRADAGDHSRGYGLVLSPAFLCLSWKTGLRSGKYFTTYKVVKGGNCSTRICVG